MVHTKDFKLAYKNETAFCSGSGATANTPEENETADLTAFDRVTQFNPGLAKPERVEEFHLASGLEPDLVYTAQIKPGAGSLTAYFQSSLLYDWAVSATLGTIGTTKTLCYYSPLKAKDCDLYGCYVTKYTLTAERGKPVMQEVEFAVNRSLAPTTKTIVWTGLGFVSTAPTMFTALTLTIDTILTAAAKFNSFKLIIENTYSEGDDASTLNSLYEIQPVLTERVISYEIGHLSNGSDTWDADELNSTVQLVTSTLALSVFTLTPVNYNVWSTNQDELESRGIIKHLTTFRRGVASTQVKS